MSTGARGNTGLPSENATREQIIDLVTAAVRHQSDPEPSLALHTDNVVIVNIAL